MKPIFYVGLHQPHDAPLFTRSMVSVNRLVRRRGDFYPQEWIMDSGAFTRLARGVGHLEIGEYARQIDRWARCGQLLAAVSQDYMCEPFMLARVGATVRAQLWYRDPQNPVNSQNTSLSNGLEFNVAP